MKLFEPIRIGHVTVENRIAFAPTHMGYATAKGELTDQHLCHYSARAKGGTGLIIVEGTGITGKYAFSGGRGIVCMGDFYREGFKALAEVIHFAGAKAFVQIVLGQGAQALSSHKIGKDLVAPSEVATRIDEANLPKALRKKLRELKISRTITQSTYRKIYGMAGSGEFKSIADMERYIKNQDLWRER